MDKSDDEPVLDLDLGDDEIQQKTGVALTEAKLPGGVQNPFAGLPPQLAEQVEKRLKAEAQVNDETRRKLVFMKVLPPKNGDQMPSPSPCKCGYRHWFEGQEYDYTFMFNMPDGPVWLAYNRGDNAYDIAQRFIDKHRLNLNTLNDRPIVTKLAEEIMRHTLENTDESKLTEAERLGIPAFDPYKAQISVPANALPVFNKQTGKFEKTTYLMVEREEEEKRKIQRELVAKKLAQERTAEEIEKERIRQRMEQDRREKEAEAKLRREMEGTAAATSTIQKPVLDQHGNLTWQHRSIYAAASQTPGQTLSGGSGTLSGGSGSLGGSSTSSSSGHSKPTATAASRPKESGGIRTLSDFRSDERSQPMPTGPADPSNLPRGRNLLQDRLRKEEWTLPLMLLRLRIHGKERLERDLKDSGFSSNEANGYIMIAELMAESSEQKRRTPQPSSFTPDMDPDDDYDSDDDLMYGRFGARPRPVSPSPSQNPQSSSSSSSSSLAPGSWAAQQLADLPQGGSGSYAESTAIFAATAAVPPPQPPKREIVLNTSEPTTNINLRLHNGSAIKVQVNLTHTVEDLLDHAAAHCPPPAGASVSLIINFPKKVLTDTKQTVRDAQLQNATIIQSVSK